MAVTFVSRTIFIVTGGRIGDVRFLTSRLSAAGPDDVVCADGGANHLYDAGLVPGVIIGDMDSVEPDKLLHFEREGCRLIRHSHRKDKTDTQLALEYVLEKNPDKIAIIGAGGGRIDHALANISLLVMGAEKKIDVTLIDEWCEVFLVSDQRVINGEPGQTVSFLPLSSQVSGISLNGFEYPLTDGAMELGRPYGISNILVSEQGSVSVKGGYLLGIRYFKAGVFPGMD
jgi:thiamine pyrophosphokinase